MAMMNDKRQYAVERCIETMFEGENYAISKLGTQEGIDKITADNLKSIMRILLHHLLLIFIYAVMRTQMHLPKR